MLDFNKPLKGLDGKEVIGPDEKPINLGQFLASQLASAGKGDALKMFTWAQKVYNGEVLDLDPSDASTLKEFIKANDSMTVLAKAQLLNVFKD
jgi:hypothetical protein